MATREKHLIVGGDGLLGRALEASLKQVADVVVTTRRRETIGPNRWLLDLATEPKPHSLPDGVSTVWLMAAVTSQVACRQSPETTRAINTDRTVALAEMFARQGAFVVFPSTNLVFDGTSPKVSANAVHSPRTEYGRQKAAAEAGLANLGERIGIVRLTKVLPPGFPLLRDWRISLQERRPIRPFRDLRMAPVPLDFAVETLRRVGIERIAGVTQVSADRDVSYAEAAGWLAESMGVPELVQPISVLESGVSLEWRPEHTTLDASRCRDLGLVAPDVRSTVLAAAT